MNYALIAKPWRRPPFEGFPPLDGTVPELPFEDLPRIAARARKLLSDRTNEEVILAAELIDDVVEFYFDSIQNKVAFELLKQYPGSAKILSKDFIDGDDTDELLRMDADIDEIMEGGYVPNLVLSVPDYPTKNSVSDIDSLKEIAELLNGQWPTRTPGDIDFFKEIAELLHLQWPTRTPNSVGDIDSLKEIVELLNSPWPTPTPNSVAYIDSLKEIVELLNSQWPTRTKNSVGDIDSLKEIVELLNSPWPTPTPNTLDEYFAVLALRHVEDCSRFLAVAFPEGDSTQLGQPSPGVVSTLTVATQALAIALEAVCYAEHLAVLQKIGVPLVGEKKPLKDLAQEFHKSIVLDCARLGANARHTKHRTFRQQALKLYDEQKSEFRSVQAAARAISKDVPMEPSTIAEWIYTHRKQPPAGTP